MNSAPAVPLSNPATPSPPLSSHPPPLIEPSAPPAPSMPPHQSLYPNLGAQTTTYGEKLQTRSFECEFYILEQANTAYNNTDSFEYNQAIQIIQSAVSETYYYTNLDSKITNISKMIDCKAVRLKSCNDKILYT